MATKKKIKKKTTRKKALKSQPDLSKIERPDYISWSQIDLFECPFKYRHIRLLKDIKNESVPLIEGTVCHEIIKDYTDHVRREGIDFEEMDRLIDYHYDRLKLPEHTRADARLNLIHFAQWGLVPERIIDFEQKCEINLSGGRKVVVVIDRADAWKDINGTVLDVIDYKNFHKVLSEADVDENDQFRLYKYAAANHLYPNFDYVRVGACHIRYKGFIRWGKIKKVDDLADEFENTEKWLIRQYDLITKTAPEDMQPNPSEACWKWGGCPVMIEGKCPVYTKTAVRAWINGTNTVDSVRAYRKINIDRDIITKGRDLNGGLQNHFKTNDPMEVDGKNVGYIVNRSYRYDLEKFVKLCRKNDIDMKGLTLSKTDVERILDANYDMKNLTDQTQKIIDDMKIEKASNKLIL